MNLESGDEARRPFWSGRRVIDCDLHNQVPSLEVLKPYLADHWCAYIEESAFRGPDADDYPKAAPTTVRPGLEWDGEVASQLSLMREQVLDLLQVDYGVLDCAYRVQGVHNPDLAAALASAINGWQAEHWLDRDPRLRASIVAPTQNPVLAAREIDAWGDDPRFVQVVMPVRSLVPTGIGCTTLSMRRPIGTVWWWGFSSEEPPAIPPRPAAGSPPIWRSTPPWPRSFSPR